MYSDPITVTVATVAKSLAKVGSSLNQSVFRTADRAYQFTITQTSGRRNQARVRLDNNKVVTDPLASDRNIPVGMSVYTVVDTPLTGYSVSEVKDQIIAHADWLKTAGNADKLVGGEI